MVQPVEGHAQKEQKAGFGLRTDSQVLSGRPGRTVESSLTIVTTGQKRTTHYEIRTMDIGQTSIGTTHPVKRGLGARSCAGWIQIPERVEVPPGGTITVQFSISIPRDATGGYYAYVMVTLLTERPKGEPVVIMVEPALSVKVELEVPGRSKMELRVTDISFDRNPKDGNPVMRLEVKNEGDLKTSLEGDILLYGPRGSFPVRVQIPMDVGGRAHAIYPGLSMRVFCPFVKAPSPGNYRAQVRLLMAGRWRTKSDFDIFIPTARSSEIKAAVLLGRSEFDVDVSVEPSYVEVTLPSGATRTVSIRVQNRDSVAINARASVVHVIQESNGFMTYADITDSSEQWVRVSPAEWTLGPHSGKRVVLQITAPEYDAGMDAHCAVRILGTANLDEEDWLSEADLGVPIIAIPPGAPPPELEISNLRVIRPGPKNNPTAAVLVVQNRGGRTAELVGKIVLERAATAQRVQTMYISETDGLILPPGVVREFRMPLTYLDQDEFRLKVEVSLVGQPQSVKSKELTFVCYQGPD